jgi:PleD family two-component response regulator
MKPLPRILLVDDSLDARLIAEAALSDGDFALETAGSAQEAYARLGLEGLGADLPPEFDLILLDILMPNIDGVEACAAIRSTRRYRDVPILMVSGQNDTGTLSQAFIAGANDYVSKPLNPMELQTRVRSALRFKREIDRRRARENELRSQSGDGQGSLAAAFDPVDALPERPVIEAAIAAAAESQTPTALLLLSVDRFAAHRSEAGEVEAQRLRRRLATELAALPAPLGSLFGGYGEGLFMVVAPGVDAERMAALAQAASERIQALALDQGSSPTQDRLTISAVAGEATGDALRTLPAALIARLDETPEAQGNRIIRMDHA